MSLVPDTPSHFLLKSDRKSISHFHFWAVAFVNLTVPNLGLIADKRGDEANAVYHYRATVAQTDSEKIRRLANAKLSERTDARSPAFENRWILYASVGAGFDDNVTLTDEVAIDAVSDQKGYFIETVGVASRYFSGDVSDGWRLDLGGYYRANVDLDDFNVGSGIAGATYNRVLQRWHLQAGLRSDLHIVGGAHFTTGAGLQFSAYRTFGKMGLRVTEVFKYVDGASDYQYLTGTQSRTKLELTRKFDRVSWGIAYAYEVNERDDLTFTDEFFSYSPSKHLAAAKVHYDFSDRLFGEFRFDVRSSSYDHENIEVNLDGSVEQAKRDETRFGVTIRLTQRLFDMWRLFAEYQHTDNDSNFDRYTYSSNRYLVGIELAN